MVDEQQPDPDHPTQENAPAHNATPDADWGEDWESAFQAEEILFDEESASEAGANDLPPGETGGFADLPDFDEEEPTEPTAGETGAGEPGATAGPSGWFAAGLLSRFSSLPLPARLGIPAALILLLTIGLLLPLLRTGAPNEMQPVPLPPTAGTQPEQAKLPEVPAAATTPEIVPQTALPSLELEKKRTKWPFASFLIPAEDPENKGIVFVTVELSLVTLLDEDQQLPLSQKPLVRDIIFQFFVNRPLYDLRRYSLARGEMKRQLLEWLGRQWPDGELEAIIVHRYELS